MYKMKILTPGRITGRQLVSSRLRWSIGEPNSLIYMSQTMTIDNILYHKDGPDLEILKNKSSDPPPPPPPLPPPVVAGHCFLPGPLPLPCPQPRLHAQPWPRPYLPTPSAAPRPPCPCLALSRPCPRRRRAPPPCSSPVLHLSSPAAHRAWVRQRSREEVAWAGSRGGTAAWVGGRGVVEGSGRHGRRRG